MKNNNIKNRDIAMDLMRIIMMLLIVNFHFFFGINRTDSIFYGYANGGWGSVGTCMFFMLSGYFLSMNHGEKSFGLRETLGFYKRHLPSLFIPFYLIYITGFVITAIDNGTPAFGGSPVYLLLSLLGIDNYAAFMGYEVYYFGVGEWYSTIIILLYLLAPLILTAKRKWPLVSGIAFLTLYILNLIFPPLGLSPDALPATGLLLFYVGTIFATYRDKILSAKWLLLPALAMSILVVFVRLPGYPDYSLPWKNLLGISLFTIFFIVFHLIIPQGKNIRAISLLGQSMYCVYLSHHFIFYRFFMDWAMDVQGARLLLIYLLYILVVLMMSLIFYGISQKILKALKNLRKPHA